MHGNEACWKEEASDRRLLHEGKGLGWSRVAAYLLQKTMMCKAFPLLHNRLCICNFHEMVIMQPMSSLQWSSQFSTKHNFDYYLANYLKLTSLQTARELLAIGLSIDRKLNYLTCLSATS
jgi:hypothetical protein